MSPLVLSAQTADGPPELPLMRQKYKEVITHYTDGAAERAEQLRNEYAAALTSAREQALRSGALQDGEHYRSERDRFRATGTLTADDVRDDVESLSELQQRYVSLFKDASTERDQKIRDVSQRYMKALSSLSSEFSQTGEKAWVDACQAEATRVKRSAVYRKSVMRLERDEREAAEEAERQAEVVNDVWKAHIYSSGEEPQEKKHRHTGYHTGPHSRALVSPVSLRLATYEKRCETTVEEPAMNTVIMRKYAATHVVPRIVCTATSQKGIGDGVLVIEYVVRNKGGRKQQSVARVEHIAIPALSLRDSVDIDAGGIALFDQDYIRTGADGRQSVIIAKELDGIIVSLFNQDEKLLYQRCTRRSIAKFASPLQSAVRDQEEARILQSQ